MELWAHGVMATHSPTAGEDPSPLLSCWGRVARTSGRGQADVVAAAQAALLLTGAPGVVPAPGSAVITGEHPSTGRAEAGLLWRAWREVAMGLPRACIPWHRSPLSIMGLLHQALQHSSTLWQCCGISSHQNHGAGTRLSLRGVERSCLCPHSSLDLVAPRIPPWCTVLHDPAHRPSQHVSPLLQSPSLWHLTPSCRAGVAVGAPARQTAHGVPGMPVGTRTHPPSPTLALPGSCPGCGTHPLPRCSTQGCTSAGSPLPLAPGTAQSTAVGIRVGRAIKVPWQV